MGSCMSSLSSEVSTKADRYALTRVSSLRTGRWRKSKVGRKEEGKDGVDGITDKELRCIPERKFENGESERACLYTQQGRKGVNQDAMLLWEDFASREDTVFCGVFDGHGPNGHLVARKVRDSLPVKLHNQWKVASNDSISLPNGYMNEGTNLEEKVATGSEEKEEWTEHLDVSGSGKLPDVFLTVRQSLLKACELMDNELKVHTSIDCLCSGSTAVTLVKQGQNLVIGNIGDSRAVLGTRDDENSLIAVEMTVDLKPNLPREAARIQQCNGRVFALNDEPDVARLWLPNGDSPGLAMSRAFGDFCLKDYGLISVPDITYHQVDKKDEFVVLATDGVWDVFSNKEVVDVVASAPTRAKAAKYLVDCAVQAWQHRFPTSKSDDCAVICLFLHPLTSKGYDHGTDPQKAPNGPVETTTNCTDERATNANVHPPNSFWVPNSSMQHPYALDPNDLDEIVPDSMKGESPERCQPAGSLANCLETPKEEEWTALEGVTRVNSLLNLPRFISSDKGHK